MFEGQCSMTSQSAQHEHSAPIHRNGAGAAAVAQP
jgi:hypothetical protein